MSLFKKKQKVELPEIEGEVHEEEVPVRKTFKERWNERKYRMWMSETVVLEHITVDRSSGTTVYHKHISRMKHLDLIEQYPQAVHKSGEPGHYAVVDMGEHRETENSKMRVTATDLKQWMVSDIVGSALDSMGSKKTREGAFDMRILIALVAVGVVIAGIYVFMVLM